MEHFQWKAECDGVLAANQFFKWGWSNSPFTANSIIASDSVPVHLTRPVLGAVAYQVLGCPTSARYCHPQSPAQCFCYPPCELCNVCCPSFLAAQVVGNHVCWFILVPWVIAVSTYWGDMSSWTLNNKCSVSSLCHGAVEVCLQILVFDQQRRKKKSPVTLERVDPSGQQHNFLQLIFWACWNANDGPSRKRAQSTQTWTALLLEKVLAFDVNSLVGLLLNPKLRLVEV